MLRLLKSAGPALLLTAIGWVGLTLAVMALGQAVKSLAGSSVFSSITRLAVGLILLLVWLLSWWFTAKLIVDRYSGSKVGG